MVLTVKIVIYQENTLCLYFYPCRCIGDHQNGHVLCFVGDLTMQRDLQFYLSIVHKIEISPKIEIFKDDLNESHTKWNASLIWINLVRHCKRKSIWLEFEPHRKLWVAFTYPCTDKTISCNRSRENIITMTMRLSYWRKPSHYKPRNMITFDYILNVVVVYGTSCVVRNIGHKYANMDISYVIWFFFYQSVIYFSWYGGRTLACTLMSFRSQSIEYICEQIWVEFVI